MNIFKWLFGSGNSQKKVKVDYPGLTVEERLQVMERILNALLNDHEKDKERIEELENAYLSGSIGKVQDLKLGEVIEVCEFKGERLADESVIHFSNNGNGSGVKVLEKEQINQASLETKSKSNLKEQVFGLIKSGPCTKDDLIAVLGSHGVGLMLHKLVEEKKVELIDGVYRSIPQ